MKTMNELIAEILLVNGIANPDTVYETENGPRTAFNILEGHVLCALEEIDDLEEVV